MTHLRVFVASGLVILSAIAANAQTSRVESGSTVLGGLAFYYETRLEPPLPPLGDSLNMLVFTTTPHTVHRVMLDRANKVYFGYDARIGRAQRGGDGQNENDMYSLEFGPLTLTAEDKRILGEAGASWRQLAAPRFPAPRTIRAGEVLELALLTNDTWGQRLIEYITVGEAPRQGGFNPDRLREFSFPAGPPRDFSAADVALTLTAPHVRWSYQAVSGGRRGGVLRNVQTSGEASGGIVWIYVPNAGRFLLSIVPRGQFQRAGTVRGTSLSFAADGNTYIVNSATRIAPGDGAFNLYVLRQPAWKPSYEHADLDTVHIGAADKAEYLLDQ